MLNVAITQDNVLGSQVGMSLNPDQVVGTQYRHMHMLRHLITGQWGEEITTTTQGSFVEKTYNYTIPANLGSPNAIPAYLEDLHFIAFVAQGHQEILTGCEAQITNINMPALYPRLNGLTNTTPLDCSENASVSALVINSGSESINSLTFEYIVANGTPQTYNWTGSISSMQSSNIDLPAFPVSTNVNQQVKVRITAVNGQAYDGAQLNTTLKKVLAQGGGAMTIKIKTDNYAEETSYKIYGPNGNVVQSGNTFSNSQVHEIPFTPSELGCYRIQLLDSYGDGISSGYLRVYGADGTLLLNITGSSFTSEANAMLSVTMVGIDEVESESVVVYPNPASDRVRIVGSDDIQMVEIYNLQGQKVSSTAGNVHEISVNGLSNGLYIFRITTDKGVSSVRVAVN